LKPDAVFAMENGADGTRFLQQNASFGLKGRIPLLGAMNTTDQSVIRTLGAECEGVSGKVEDRDAFLDAVRETELADSPLGKTVRLDAYGNPVYDVYIRKVVRRPDGKYWNVPIEVYPNVSQFWKYDPATYMKQPAYSRTFQGIKRG
jgi:branched-chain amino acid transport system substrate-binding protein